MTEAAITGDLVLQEEEIEAASREAVGPDGLAASAVGLAMLAAGVVWNLITDAGRGSSLISKFALPLSLLSLVITHRERTRQMRQIAERLKLRAPSARYQFDPQGLSISGETANVRLECRTCRGYEELTHAFAFYFDSHLPELVMKRAFGGDELDALRHLLERCLPATAVGRRALRRAIVISAVIGMFVLGCGVGLAMAVRH